MERKFYDVEELNPQNEWVAGIGSYNKKDALNFAEDVEKYHPGQKGRLKENKEYYCFLLTRIVSMTPLSDRTPSIPCEALVVHLSSFSDLAMIGADEFNVQAVVSEKEIPSDLKEGFIITAHQEASLYDNFGERHWDMTNLFFTEEEAKEAIDSWKRESLELWKDEADDHPAKVRDLNTDYTIRKIKVYA